MYATRALAAAGSKPESFLPFAATPAPRASRRLTAAVRALAGYSRREPDATLDELRVALLGTGLTWSADGKLVCSPHRMALVSELDDLIEVFGKGTKVSELFL